MKSGCFSGVVFVNCKTFAVCICSIRGGKSIYDSHLTVTWLKRGKRRISDCLIGHEMPRFVTSQSFVINPHDVCNLKTSM